MINWAIHLTFLRLNFLIYELRLITLVFKAIFKYSARNVVSQQMLFLFLPKSFIWNRQPGFLFKTIKFWKVKIALQPANLCHSQFTGRIVLGVLF